MVTTTVQEKKIGKNAVKDKTSAVQMPLPKRSEEGGKIAQTVEETGARIKVAIKDTEGAGKTIASSAAAKPSGKAPRNAKRLRAVSCSSNVYMTVRL